MGMTAKAKLTAMTDTNDGAAPKSDELSSGPSLLPRNRAAEGGLDMAGRERQGDQREERRI